MQEIQQSSLSIIQQTQSKIEESLLVVGYQIDSAFARIDDLIDSLLQMPFKNINHSTGLYFELPQCDLFSISGFKYQQQTFESVTPLIQKINWNEIQLQEKNLIQRYSKQNMINQEKGGNIESQKFKLKNLIVFSQPKKQVIQYNNEQQLMDKQVEFKLIDDSTKQSSQCYAIAFNNTGLIMISCCIKQIKIWNFEKGKLNLQILMKLIKKLLHAWCIAQRKIVLFLAHKIKHQSEWKFSQPYQQHDGTVNCLILNKQEDQLISRGCDYKIIVWLVDFIKNELVFLYSLDKHTNTVFSLSFNQSETLLASCGYGTFIIWEKGLKEKWDFKYTQNVSAAGYKIHVINDQQIFWVPMHQYINELLVFELQNGNFSNNQNKTINFIRNYESQDQSYFPIMHNKDRNVRLIRHKQHIYLIREFNDSTFQIVSTLNCQSQEIYGTMTNNGQYLVFHNYNSGNDSKISIFPYRSYKCLLLATA
ncbi:unnamed protein product [Paramecium octaurelia]|uniref:WD40-repeat-containing domain n=1 Tax=Paramecium octaurelia TaxID=43137 RepID=A0A8S1YJ65_PAROT|nr:unnamed protein product [Paramecium octaurelia]